MQKEEVKKTKEEEEEKDKEKKEDKKEMDVEGLKSYIQAEALDALDKSLEKKSDELVKKFLNGVAEQRKKAIETKQTPKKTSDEEIVRKWFKALLYRDSQAMAEVQKDYLQGGEAGQGGDLIPPQLLAEVNKFTEEYGVARRDMRYLPFSGAGNSRNIPALASSVSVFWVGEGGAKPSTKPTFKLVPQTLEKIVAIVPFTEEIVEDSAINLISLLGELFGEAVAAEEDRVFLNGDTGNGDPYMGVIRATGVVNTDMANNETPANITADHLNDLIYSVPTQVRNTGKFYLHSTVFQLLQQLRDAVNGGYIVQSPVGDRPGAIWNRPYELVDVLPDADTTDGTLPFMFFTNLAKTCVYGDKGDIKVKILEEATVQSAEESPADLNLATQDMMAMRIKKRVGYVPVLPAGIGVLRTGT